MATRVIELENTSWKMTLSLMKHLNTSLLLTSACHILGTCGICSTLPIQAELYCIRHLNRRLKSLSVAPPRYW
jgi:hypothetical protein